jgi:hypothetical protein
VTTTTALNVTFPFMKTVLVVFIEAVRVELLWTPTRHVRICLDIEVTVLCHSLRSSLRSACVQRVTGVNCRYFRTWSLCGYVAQCCFLSFWWRNFGVGGGRSLWQATPVQCTNSFAFAWNCIAESTRWFKYDRDKL